MELTQNYMQNLASTFITGYLRGYAVNNLKIQVTRDTDFAPLTANLIPESTREGLQGLFSSSASGLEILEQLDSLIDAQEEVLGAAREYLFDLLMLTLIVNASEEHGEEYLDSPEWLAMEEQSLHRGTELLNLLIYLRDCRENGLKPTLEDFLNEFLLVTDDQFQDEFFIYEDLIRQQSLLEGKDEDIFTAGSKVESEELREVFVPFLLFFKHMGASNPGTVIRMLNLAPNRGVTAGVFQLLHQFFLIEESGVN